MYSVQRNQNRNLYSASTFESLVCSVYNERGCRYSLVTAVCDNYSIVTEHSFSHHLRQNRDRASKKIGTSNR